MAIYTSVSDFIALLSEGGRFVIQEEIHFAQGDIASNHVLPIADNSTIVFDGGKLVNDTGATIIIEGDNITLLANPEHIFAGNNPFEFRSSRTYNKDNITYHYPQNWIMDRAYPQWFGAKDCSALIEEAKDQPTPADKLEKMNDISDASAAINAAIRLKQRGEVFIPRGWYKLSRHIRMLPGIKLRGEWNSASTSDGWGTVLFAWESASSRNDNGFYNHPEIATSQTMKNLSLDDVDFPRHFSHIDWYNMAAFDEAKPNGYMILANIADKFNMLYEGRDIEGLTNIASPSGNAVSLRDITPVPEPRNYPKSIEYSAIQSTPPTGTEIADIALTSRTDIPGGTDYRFLRGILAAYCIRLTRVRVSNLSQALAVTNMYADARHIEECTFHCPKFTGDDNLDTLYPEKIYAFHLHSYGDALRFHGNHVVNYCEKIGALHLRDCNGGIVAGNILNSDSLIEMCRGITFESNHVEYGAKLTIASAAVGIRDNFFWRGSRPSIIIRQTDSDLYYYFHSVVDMADNIFFLAAVADQLVTAAESLSPYDVAIDRYACIEMRNCFRSPNRHRNGESSNVGINMAKFWLSLDHDQPTEQVVEDSDSYEPFEEFNEISHIASCGCSINDFNVTPKPITLKKMQQYTLTMRLNKHDCRTEREKKLEKYNQNLPEGATPALIPYVNGWKDNRTFEPSYQYKAWLYLDLSRKILMHGPINMPDTYLPNHSNAAKAAPLIYENIRLVIGNSTDYSNMHLPMGQMWLYMERIAKLTEREDPPLNGNPTETIRYQRKAVALPVCASTQYWDNGENLSGYEWGAGTAPSETSPGFTTPAVNGNVERVQYHGENVECLLSSLTVLQNGQPDIVGEWTKGDKLLLFDNGYYRQWIYDGSEWIEPKGVIMPENI